MGKRRNSGEVSHEPEKTNWVAGVGVHLSSDRKTSFMQWPCSKLTSEGVGSKLGYPTSRVLFRGAK